MRTQLYGHPKLRKKADANAVWQASTTKAVIERESHSRLGTT